MHSYFFKKNSKVDGYASSQPNALILKSASYSVNHFSNMNEGEGYPISPLYQVKNNFVPTIMFHGTNDYIVSYKEFSSFVEKMKKLKNNFVHHIFEGADHFDLFRDENHKTATEMIDKFLIKNGFLAE